MSYQKITSFAVKDTMIDSNPLKVVRGKEFDDEFDAITAAMAAQEGVISGLVTTPSGGMLMFAGQFAPAGFLLCDGAARSRNTYAALFQAIGTTFGAGDSSTTFNVPNLTGRFPYGGLLGQTGGSADATLPTHTHALTTTVTDPTHAHYLAAGNAVVELNSSATPGATGGFTGGQGLITASTSQPAATGITVTTTIASTGAPAIAANLPPFVGLNFIIKI